MTSEKGPSGQQMQVLDTLLCRFSHPDHADIQQNQNKGNWTCFVVSKTFHHSFKKISQFSCSCLTTRYHTNKYFFPSTSFNCRDKNSTLTLFTIAVDRCYSQFKAEGCSQIAELNVCRTDTPHPVSVSSTQQHGKCEAHKQIGHPSQVWSNAYAHTQHSLQ